MIISKIGINVITEIFSYIKKRYIKKNNIDLIKTIILKTAIIAKE